MTDENKTSGLLEIFVIPTNEPETNIFLQSHELDELQREARASLRHILGLPPHELDVKEQTP